MSAKLLIFCVFLVSSSLGKPRTVGGIPFVSSRIIGGQDAARDEFPHLISLRTVTHRDQYHVCGGSILNENWILTAAHCDLSKAGIWLYIKAGKYSRNAIEDAEQFIRVESVFVHERYNPDVYTCDIALLKLANPLEFNEHVQPIRLPKRDNQLDGKVVVLAGWGLLDYNDKNSYADVLQKVTMSVIDLETCRMAIDAVGINNRNPINEAHVCTGPLAGGIAGCDGDSGGPLIEYQEDGKPEVVGIASWTVKPCGLVGAPTVYTRVSSYVDWIMSTIYDN